MDANSIPQGIHLDLDDPNITAPSYLIEREKIPSIDQQLTTERDQGDPVNHPKHYTKGSIECIDAIEASMTKEGFTGYLKGNVIKYMWRYKNKNNPVEDLEKAIWYLQKLHSVVFKIEYASEEETND